MSLSTRLTAAMVLLVAFTAATAGYLSYRNVEAIVLPAELTRLESRAHLQAALLTSQVASARADVLAMSKTRALAGLVTALSARAKNPRAPAPDPVLRERLTNLFTAQLAAKPEYAAFRLVGIANGGRELLHVDRSDTQAPPRVSPESELPARGDRDYFKETIALKEGEVHISPIALSAAGVPTSDSPRVPFLRVSTPVFAPDGAAFGFLVINIDMRSALAEIAASTVFNGAVYIVNAEGDYILHPDNARTFGFDLGRRYRVQQDFPELAAALGSDKVFQGTVTAPQGVATAAALIPLRFGNGPRIGILETIAGRDALASVAGVQRATIIAGAAAALLAALLAAWIARSLTRPLGEMAESFARFTGEEDVPVPHGGAGEIGMLAGAFDRMSRKVRENTAALQDEIAERKNAQRRERLYAAAVQSASDAIVTTTLDGAISTWNSGAQRLFGYTAEEAIGQPIGLIATDEQRAQQNEHGQRVRRGEHLDGIETIRRAKDGTPREVSLAFSPISDGSGAILGVTAIYRDIGERKRQERLLQERAEELQRSNAELEQFAYVASHDLQEPLRMVASYAELLAERYQGKLDAKADKYIGYAVDGAKRMQRLVNDLLSFSRAGRHEVKTQVTDLNKLVGDVVKSLDRAVAAAGATVDFSGLPEIVTDPGQMGQVFQNLISNAVKFRGDKHPLVTIAAEPYGTGWKFSVRDNGIGIEQQYSDRIFQMFQRLHDRASYEGNGIGLPIAKKIVERHGGRIWFDSVPGEGTAFHFTLPQAQEKAA